MRRVLNQVAWGAVRTKDSFFKELVSTLDTAVGRTQGGVGRGTPERPVDLEGAAREGSVYRTGTASDGPDGDEAARGAAHQANAKARLYD